MTRWLGYLLLAMIAEVAAVLLAPILPAFARPALGSVNNNSTTAIEPRLPRWLSWFQTPDNSLFGDANWRAAHRGGYWSQVGWLLRNRAYGFKWSVLAAPMGRGRIIEGDPLINYHTGRLGTLRITMGRYWQWKRIGRICGSLGYMVNLGWLLDDASQKKALFLFSPRIVRLDTK